MEREPEYGVEGEDAPEKKNFGAGSGPRIDSNGQVGERNDGQKRPGEQRRPAPEGTQNVAAADGAEWVVLDIGLGCWPCARSLARVEIVVNVPPRSSPRPGGPSGRPLTSKSSKRSNSSVNLRRSFKKADVLMNCAKRSEPMLNEDKASSLPSAPNPSP